LLRDRGCCYIEVPNAGAPHAAPGKMFHYAHIYNFTKDTLEMLAAKADFTIDRWLSGTGDKNLRVILRGGRTRHWSVTAGSHERAMRAMTGYSRTQYYLRWTYARQRLRTLITHQCDRFLAARRARKLLRLREPMPLPHLDVRTKNCPSASENGGHSANPADRRPTSWDPVYAPPY
jgi:hypothetical protein